VIQNEVRRETAMKTIRLIAAVWICAALSAGTQIQAEGGAEALKHTVKDIDGKEVKLEDKYKGKVVMIVNVASKCGLTPQYEQLQALHEKYHDQGLEILGFPANNFGRQEPGTELEIKEFCASRYNVGFDMFSKVSVKDDSQEGTQHPLYKDLTREETNGQFAGDIKWNFTKFLVGKEGKVVARFEPKTKPDDAEVVKAIEAELAK
jgi:glutathione peroxidase